MTATPPTLFDLDAIEAPPCARCRRPSAGRLYSGRAYGVAGHICGPCRGRLYREVVASRPDLAADSWGDYEPRDDAEREAEDRWLARRVLIVWAAEMARSRRPPRPRDRFADWREADRSWRARLPESRRILRAAKGMVGAGV